MCPKEKPATAIEPPLRGDALVAEALRFIEEQRVRCLWFIRRDYRPTDRDGLVRLLGHIERRGDLKAYVKARQLKEWLSQNSSGKSAS